MNDSDWIKSVREVYDPLQMLQVIVNNEMYFGFDPYYKDLRQAMLDQAQRILDWSGQSKEVMPSTIRQLDKS